MTVDDYFSTGPPHERPIFEAVIASLETVGPVHIEAVSVGIFLKNPRKFAELRPMQRWVALSFSLSRSREHRSIVRKVMPYGGRYYHTANLATPDEFDAVLAAMLAEAYDEARSLRRSG